MTHEPIEINAHTQEKLEVRILADTILSAFELADSIESHDIAPGSHQIERSISPDILSDEHLATLLPSEILDQIDTQNVGMDVTFQFTSQETRPSLELRFFSNTKRAPFYFATAQRRSGMSSVDQEFKGTAILDPRARDHEFSISNESVAKVIQDLIKSEELVVTDEGVLLMDLLHELILDPQHPPVARYIYEVLAMKDMPVRDETNYPLSYDDQDFLVRTSIENGKTTVITIIEVLQDDVAVLGDDISHSYSAVGARISRTQLSQAVEFFKPTKEGDEIPFDGDTADLLRLREQISYLTDKITGVQP